MEAYNESKDKNLSPENRGRNAEVLQRLMGMAKGIDGLGERTAIEIFTSGNEDTRREVINALSGEQYCQLIAGINGILRGKEKENWNMDGTRVTVAGQEAVGTHIFPNYLDKKEIIVKSLEGARAMNASGRDMGEIGMLLGSLLVETHPFADGNGRTSRLIYVMLRGGFSKEEVEGVLGEYGREELDMALPKGGIDAIFEKRYGTHNTVLNTHQIGGVFSDKGVEASFRAMIFPEGTSDITKDTLIQAARNDDRLLIGGILSFLQQHPEIEVEDFLETYGERRILLFQPFISQLSKGQMEELTRTYWDTKKRYTEDMIDIFVNPNKPEYKIEKSGKEIRLLDYFKERIANKEILYP